MDRTGCISTRIGILPCGIYSTHVSVLTAHSSAVIPASLANRTRLPCAYLYGVFHCLLTLENLRYLSVILANLCTFVGSYLDTNCIVAGLKILIVPQGAKDSLYNVESHSIASLNLCLVSASSNPACLKMLLLAY